MEKQNQKMVNLEEKKFIDSYNANDYERPSVATDTVIFTVIDIEEENYRKLPKKELRVLLIKRREHPYKDMWALPGGFLQADETVEEAAYRELKEETDVDCDYLEQLYTFSTPGRDPRTWVISCAHMALIDSTKIKLHPGDDALDAAWFKLTSRETMDKTEIILEYGDIRLKAEIVKASVPSSYKIIQNGGIAFDHPQIILYALEHLRKKMDNIAVAFHLMPDEFTISQLQQIYEVILDKSLLTPAFRRKVTPYVEETGKYYGDAGHRPSQLYKKKGDKND